jgi:aspartate-semialdehyde dehydrogenase
MGIRAGIVGWGPVGQNIFNCIHELGLDCDEIRVLAVNERDEQVDGQTIHVNGLGEDFDQSRLSRFEGLDVAFFAGREGEKGAAKQWGLPAIEKYDVYCIDNGADFRLEADVPLIVPEVNMDAAGADTKFIASPNCSTIQMCVALAPLYRVTPARRILVTTFQSVSGYGREAQAELRGQLSQCDPECLGDCPEFDPKVFRKPIVLDCLPHIDAFMDNGYTKEELKMHYETQKIFSDPRLSVVATTVRVPVDIGHAESVNVEFAGKMNAEMALNLWREGAPDNGLVVIDQPAKDTPGWPTPSTPSASSWAGHTYADERAYPTQRDILCDAWKNMTLVGRARNDFSRENTLNFWCVADNLRKGAATNVVQIALGLQKMGLLQG